jgi:hypothetical protein
MGLKRWLSKRGSFCANMCVTNEDNNDEMMSERRSLLLGRWHSHCRQWSFFEAEVPQKKP